MCGCVCVCPVTFKLRLGNCFAASSSSSSSESETWTASSTLSLRLPTWTMDTQQNYEARVENKTIWITRNCPRPFPHRDQPRLYAGHTRPETTCEVVAWLTTNSSTSWLTLPCTVLPCVLIVFHVAWAPFWTSAGATITWKLTQLDFCCAHFPATVHAHVVANNIIKKKWKE